MITIVPYHPHWPAEFQRLAATVRAALGATALRIDHIGSTAIPGLAAKDIIDVQVTVPMLEPETAYTPALQAAGFVLRGGVTYDHRPPGDPAPEIAWAKRLFGAAPDQRLTNVHVRAFGHPNQRYALLFRDYLRAHPQAAAAYAEVKRRLASAFPDQIHLYTEVKDPVCDVIVAAAEEWVAATGWEPGPPDA